MEKYINNNDNSLYHVKGHQDESKNWEYLTTPEKLNVKADLIATKNARPPLNIPIPSAPFAIYIQKKYPPQLSTTYS